MEIGYMSYRKVFLAFTIVVLFASMFYSCSNQKSLAGLRQDTILVPKQYRPSTLQAKQQPIEQPKIPLKLPTEEQKVFNKKLNYVLDNAGHSFENIDLIRADISDLKSLIIDRAVILRIQKDSLLIAIDQIKTQQIEALRLAHNESKARIANEKRTADDRKQNVSNAKALNLYTGILMAFLLTLLIILLFVWLDVKRIKAKYKQQLQHE